MSKFRLKVDMSLFFNDERRLAYILVDPKWEQVQQLQDHVQKVFSVSNINLQTDGDVFIPPREHISVIKPTDIIKVIIPQKVKTRIDQIERFTFDDKTLGEESTVVKWKKPKDEGITCSTPNYRAKKKRRISPNVADLEASTKSEHSETSILSDIYKIKSQSCEMSIDIVTSTNIGNGVKDQSMGDDSDGINSTLKRRKRKRSRKKKDNESPEKQSKSNRLSSVLTPTLSSTMKMSEEISTPSHHVYFVEETNPSDENSKAKVEHVVFYCRLNMDEDMQPREIHAETSKIDQKPTTKPQIQIQENILLVESKAAACL